MNLIVAVDLSPITDKYMDKVIEIDKKLKAEIWLIHVVQPDPDFVGYEVGPQTERNFIAKKFHEHHQKLQLLAEKLRSHKLKVTPLLLQGPTVETILKEADKIDAEMVVAGSHGHGVMYNIFIGSVSKEILKESKRPVLIIPVKEDS